MLITRLGLQAFCQSHLAPLSTTGLSLPKNRFNVGFVFQFLMSISIRVSHLSVALLVDGKQVWHQQRDANVVITTNLLLLEVTILDSRFCHVRRATQEQFPSLPRGMPD